MRRPRGGDRFYTRYPWKKIRGVVLKLDKYECQRCKSKGKYKRADTVHHVMNRRDYPEWELEIYYIDKDGEKKRNLISLCWQCHEDIEAELGNRPNYQSNKEPLTPERW